MKDRGVSKGFFRENISACHFTLREYKPVCFKNQADKCHKKTEW